jgi:hypothetical protein
MQAEVARYRGDDNCETKRYQIALKAIVTRMQAWPVHPTVAQTPYWEQYNLCAKYQRIM